LKDVNILGIETSCDETSVAVVRNGREVLSNIIDSQIKIHEEFGGVVPEIASRCHTEKINQIMKKALKEANIGIEDIDGIAVTQGPGLVGALLVGISYAKGLSLVTKKPLIPVNHIEGHISANYLTHKDLEPPFLCLIISGGHTHLVNVKDYNEFEVLGKTRDDAVGEAFDKVARVVGLGYPGGPKVSKLAEQGEANIKLPITSFDNLDFSFSGIKTAVINLNHNVKHNSADLCASFEKAVTEMLLNNMKKAIIKYKPEKIVIAGGVSRNTYIRKSFDELGSELNLKVYYPEPELCTDNGAMIAGSGYYNYKNGKIADLKLNAIPNLKLKCSR